MKKKVYTKGYQDTLFKTNKNSNIWMHFEDNLEECQL